jgi:SlyX protein
MEDRIIELEIRLAHTEANLEALQQTVLTQTAEIRKLHLMLEQLADRVKALSPSNIASEAEETPPPHY